MRAQAARRRAGRRGGAGDVKPALIRAARDLFAERGYAVPLRAVAEAAGVNPAMIHYYFGGKQGLYEAVLEETVAPFLAHMQDIVASRASDGSEVRTFLEGYAGMVSANPWIPQLIIREVLSEGGSFRERFIRQFASRGRGLLIELIAREQRAGQVRADVDPVLAALSLMSLVLFPFITLPVAREVFGFETGAPFFARFVDHTERLFLDGARARTQP